MLIGHVAISLLERRYLDTELGPTLAGGLFPDILDKGLYYVLPRHPERARVGTHAPQLRPVDGHRQGRRRQEGRAELGGRLCRTSRRRRWRRRPPFYPFAHHDFQPSPTLATIIERFFKNRREVTVELVLLAWALLTT